MRRLQCVGGERPFETGSVEGLFQPIVDPLERVVEQPASDGFAQRRRTLKAHAGQVIAVSIRAAVKHRDCDCGEPLRGRRSPVLQVRQSVGPALLGRRQVSAERIGGKMARKGGILQYIGDV